MSCRCQFCLWSGREPNELLRLATDIEEQRSREAYFRMRRTVQSADVPPTVAGWGKHAAPWALGDALADGDGWVTAPGSGESALLHDDEPRPVRLSALRRIRRWLP